MDVYRRENPMSGRLDISLEALGEHLRKGYLPASSIRTGWSYYLELEIEPSGWQGLWQIPRVICEKFNLRYPTVAFGIVEQVLFDSHKAIFLILTLQDEDGRLPEKQEVRLEDLWVTKKQINSALDIKLTASSMDTFRYFYKHVWMPWDNNPDYDRKWVNKILKSRIRFSYDIQRDNMKRPLAAHIKTLLSEAQHLQQRREYLELCLSNDKRQGLIGYDEKLTRLDLRLTMIKSKLEMLVKPKTRKIYEEIMFDDEKFLKHGYDKKINLEKSITYIVTAPFTFKKQMQFMLLVGKFVTKDTLIQMCASLQRIFKGVDLLSRQLPKSVSQFSQFSNFLIPINKTHQKTPRMKAGVLPS